MRTELQPQPRPRIKHLPLTKVTHQDFFSCRDHYPPVKLPTEPKLFRPRQRHHQEISHEGSSSLTR